VGARAAARTTHQQGWSGSTSSPLLFLAGGEDHRHLQPKENAQAVGFSYFFRSVFLCFPSLSASLSSFSGLFLGLRRLLLCFRYLGGGWWRSGSVCDCCGSSLLVEEGGQLWQMRKGRHLWACCWRRAVAGGRFVDGADMEGEREGSLVWENRWVG